MKFCSKCGNQLEDNDVFCVYCGAKVEGNEATKVEEEKIETVEATIVNEEPEFYECKLCGAKVKASETNCPVCGSVIEKTYSNAVKSNNVVNKKTNSKTNNKFGITAFILGIVGDVFSMTFPLLMIVDGICAVVFGIIGITQIKKGKGKGLAFPIIGLVLGATVILISTIWYFVGDAIMQYYEEILDQFFSEISYKFFR